MKNIIYILKKNITVLRVIIFILLIISITLDLNWWVSNISNNNNALVYNFSLYAQCIGHTLILASLIITLFDILKKKILLPGLALQTGNIYVLGTLFSIVLEKKLYNVIIYCIIFIILPYLLIIGLKKRKICVIVILLDIFCIINYIIAPSFYGIFSSKNTLYCYLLLSVYIFISYNEEGLYKSVRNYIEIMKNSIKKDKESKPISTKESTDDIDKKIEILKKIKQLLDDGLITKEEFESKKKQFFDN